MTEHTKSSATSQLVANLLKNTPAVEPEPDTATQGQAGGPSPNEDPLASQARLSTLLPFPKHMDASEADDLDALTTIELFFEVDDPIERDLLVEQLSANPSGHAREFFRSAMIQDPDPYIQSQAAEALLRRGDPEATRFFYDVLADPEDLPLLNHAIQLLSHVQGESFFDVLVSLWQDEERSLEEHREALHGLEALAPERALELFGEYVRSVPNAHQLADDELALMLVIFVRHEYSQIIPDLQALLERITATPDIAPEDIELIVEEIESAIELLA